MSNPGQGLDSITFPPANEPNILNELSTRRDAFAAAALTGMLANPGYPLRPLNAAEFAFDYADAMVEARKTRHVVKS